MQAVVRARQEATEGRNHWAEGREQGERVDAGDLERGGLNALPDRMVVGSNDLPVKEECRRRWSGFVHHLSGIGP